MLNANQQKEILVCQFVWAMSLNFLIGAHYYITGTPAIGPFVTKSVRTTIMLEVALFILVIPRSTSPPSTTAWLSISSPQPKHTLPTIFITSSITSLRPSWWRPNSPAHSWWCRPASPLSCTPSSSLVCKQEVTIPAKSIMKKIGASRVKPLAWDYTSHPLKTIVIERHIIKKLTGAYFTLTEPPSPHYKICMCNSFHRHHYR